MKRRNFMKCLLGSAALPLVAQDVIAFGSGLAQVKNDGSVEHIPLATIAVDLAEPGSDETVIGTFDPTSNQIITKKVRSVRASRDLFAEQYFRETNAMLKVRRRNVRT
jgi:hypothetical protein